MAQDNIIGIAMGLDVTDLKAGLSEANKQISLANSKFKAASSSMDDWAKSTEGLEAKLEQLNTVYDLQKRKLAGIQAQYDKVAKEQGESSEAARRLKKQMYDQQATVNKTQKEIKKYSTSLEDIKKSSNDVIKSNEKLDKSFKDLDKSTKSLSDGFTVFKATLAGLATTAISSFVGGIKNAVAESREFRKEMGLLEAAANATGASFDKAKENVKEVTAITDDQGAAIEGLNNLMASGFDGDALDKITDELVGASIKWKDTLKFEGLADGLQETLATGEAIGPFAELLDRAGASTDEFNAGLAACSTEAERQQYVLNQLSKLGLSEIKKDYEENNKTLVESNRATLEYNEAMAQVGEKVEPVLTSIKKGFVDILNAFLQMSAGMDMEAIAAGISNAFQWFIDTVVPIIKDSIQFFLDNKDLIIAGIAGIGAAFLAWKVTSIITGAVNAMKSLTLATQGQTIAQKLLNLVMKANPIGIVITLIAGLVTAFVVLWKKSEAFRNFWKSLWNDIKTIVEPVVNFIKNVFTAAWNNIKRVWEASKPFFKAIGEIIKSIFSVVSGVITGDFSKAWEGIKNVFSNVGSFFKTVIKTIINAFKELPEKMVEIGKNILGGLKKGIESGISGIGNVVKKVGSKIKNGFKSLFKIKSPSRVMRDEVGKFIGEGVGVGILDSSKDVLKDVNKFSTKINKGLSSKLSTIKGGLGVENLSSLGGRSSNNSMNSNVNNFTQIINAPKQPSRIELYRQSKNLLALRGV